MESPEDATPKVGGVGWGALGAKGGGDKKGLMSKRMAMIRKGRVATERGFTIRKKNITCSKRNAFVFSLE